MSIQQELLYQELGKFVLSLIDEKEIDYAAMANKKAMMILEEIQQMFLTAKDDIGGDLTPEESAQQDFEILDGILSIFHQHGLQTGNLHDY